MSFSHPIESYVPVNFVQDIFLRMEACWKRSSAEPATVVHCSISRVERFRKSCFALVQAPHAAYFLAFLFSVYCQKVRHHRAEFTACPPCLNMVDGLYALIFSKFFSPRMDRRVLCPLPVLTVLMALARSSVGRTWWST